MVIATLRKNLGPPMPKQNDDSCLQEKQEPYTTYTFLYSVKLMLRINNFFLNLVEITLYQKKVSQFNTSQKEFGSYEIFVYRKAVR